VALLVLGATALGARHVAAVVHGSDASTLQVKGITYRVLSSEQVTGLTDADLGGMAHGVNSLVSKDRALVRVTLEVAATGKGARYDTSILRAFAGDQKLTLAPGSLGKGTLRRGGRIEGALSYVVPRNGAELRLAAPGQGPIPLLRVDIASPTDGHEHGGSGPPSSTQPTSSSTVTK
jgi:hypothetical protein